MFVQAPAARDISYSAAANTMAGRVLVRVLENATGRLNLIRRVHGYEHEIGQGRDFWRVMVERYGLSIEMVGGSLENIPRHGPLLMIANHPYGILDGLIMGYILSAMRGDFRLVAHHVFRKAEDLNRVILPVTWDETKEAVRANLATRQLAMRHLDEAGAIGIFPGGTVSTARNLFGRPYDPVWRNFTAKMAARPDTQVVPVFFDGQNSRLFQIASHAHATLRVGLLLKEFKMRIDRPVRIAVGAPIDRQKLDLYRHQPKRMMDFLREQTYALSPNPLSTREFGYEFEEKYKG